MRRRCCWLWRCTSRRPLGVVAPVRPCAPPAGISNCQVVPGLCRCRGSAADPDARGRGRRCHCFELRLELHQAPPAGPFAPSRLEDLSALDIVLILAELRVVDRTAPQIVQNVGVCAGPDQHLHPRLIAALCRDVQRRFTEVLIHLKQRPSMAVVGSKAPGDIEYAELR